MLSGDRWKLGPIATAIKQLSNPLDVPKQLERLQGRLDGKIKAPGQKEIIQGAIQASQGAGIEGFPTELMGELKGLNQSLALSIAEGGVGQKAQRLKPTGPGRGGHCLSAGASECHGLSWFQMSWGWTLGKPLRCQRIHPGHA